MTDHDAPQGNDGSGYWLQRIDRDILKCEDVLLSGINELLGEVPLVIFGERGAGTSHFVTKWLLPQLLRDNMRFLIVDAEPDPNDKRNVYSHVDSARSGIQPRAKMALDAHGIADAFEAGIENGAVIIIKDAGRDYGFSKRWLGHFYSRWTGPDIQIAKKIPPIIVTTDDDKPLLDDARASGFLCQATQFRLGAWKAPMLARYFEKFQDVDIDIDRVLEATGGQPTLVLKLVELIEDQFELEDAIDQLIRADLPVRIPWETRLKQELSRHGADLRRRMMWYISGGSGRTILARNPAVRIAEHVDERGLYLAGWLDWNRHGQWGIRSEYHQHLARKVLHGDQR